MLKERERNNKKRKRGLKKNILILRILDCYAQDEEISKSI
jgi:hypothetical protein